MHPTLWFLDTNDLESQSLAVWQARLLYTSSADNKVSKLPLFCKLRLNNRTITDDSLQQEKLAKHSVDLKSTTLLKAIVVPYVLCSWLLQ